MNYNELKKHVFFQIFYIVFIISIIVFTIIYLLTDNVSAKQESSNVTGSIYTDYNGDCTGGQVGYCALQTNSIAYKRNINTSYSGVLNSLSFELHYAMNASYQYTLNINAMSTDFRNNYLSVYACGYNSNNYNSCTSHPLDVSLRFVSKSQLQVIFPTQTYETYRIIIIGSPMSGINTYGIKSFVLTYDNNQQDFSGIIDSQNQNTTDVINNNNSNTQDIIDNQTQNTQTIIEKMTDLSYPSCSDGYRSFLIGSDKSYISNNQGRINSNPSYFVTRPIRINENTSYTLDIVNATNIQYGYYCFYNNLNQRISCTKYTDNSTTSYTFTSPANAVYFRATLYRNSNVFTNASLKGYTCVPNEYDSQVTEFQDFIKTNEINDYLTDNSNPNVDSNGINSAINSVSQTNPLSYFLTLPTTLLNSAITGLSSNSCTSWRIGHFGTIGRHDLSSYDFTFPCIDIKSKIGNDLYNIIDVFVSIGIIVLTIVRLYNTVSNYLTLGAEEEVKSHSAFLSPMDFLGNILGGNIGGVVGTARGDFD